jgi:3-oxoacyl-[acyl-carrier-protein] synthase II
MQRVVITGMGMVSPLGTGVQRNWEAVVNCLSGISQIRRIDVSDMASRIAGMVPFADAPGQGDGTFHPDDYLAPKEQKKVDLFILFALAAAEEALNDSGWHPETDEDREATGVLIGSGIGGLDSIYNTSVTLHERGPRRLSPFAVPQMLINLASGHVSIKYGLKGPNHSVVTACATGTHAIGDAARMIALGDADVMLAGGAEAGVNRLGLSSFAAARALSGGYNDDPEHASRPFDTGRDGFVIGEGAGTLVLEEYQHARARGAPIYGEIAGYGMTGDAYHITAPEETGDGGYRAMRAALRNAGMNPGDIDYINAHGTSTPAGDGIECGAVRHMFGDALDHTCMSSTKSAIGHLLGAAGAVEAIYAVKAMAENVAPPTQNLYEVSDDCAGIDLVPREARDKKIGAVLSNSFGFGGTNASLIVRKV